MIVCMALNLEAQKPKTDKPMTSIAFAGGPPPSALTSDETGTTDALEGVDAIPLSSIHPSSNHLRTDSNLDLETEPSLGHSIK